VPEAGRAGGAGVIDAVIEGDVSGQVAVGSYITQMHVQAGAVVNVQQPGQRPAVRPRPRPITRLPRPARTFLGRTREREEVLAALGSGHVVELHGRAGAGKTSIVRDLLHRADPRIAHQAVVYVHARGQPRMDLLQLLFEVLYATDGNLQLDQAAVRQHLQGAEALVVFDDIDLPRDEVLALADELPRLTLLVATEEPALLGEGVTIAVHGLPPDDAVALLESALARERPLVGAERDAAIALCGALDGHPLSILRLAHIARQRPSALEELAASISAGPPPDEAIARYAVDVLPPTQQPILALLAILAGSPIDLVQVAMVLRIANAGVQLEDLERRGLAESHGPTYTTAAPLVAEAEAALETDVALDRLLDAFVDWAERPDRRDDEMIAAVAALSGVIRVASRREYWPRVARLVAAVEGAFAVGRRWGAWESVLQAGLLAAERIGASAPQGRFLHQLGSRALCLGDATIAERYLVAALAIRQGLGDEVGAAVTRHNLEILRGGPPPPPSPGDRSGPPARPSRRRLLGVVVGALAAVLALAAIGTWAMTANRPSAPIPPVRPTVMVSGPPPGPDGSLRVQPAGRATSATATASAPSAMPSPSPSPSPQTPQPTLSAPPPPTTPLPTTPPPTTNVPR